MTTKNLRELSQRIPIASTKPNTNCITLYNRKGFRACVHNVQVQEYTPINPKDVDFSDFKDVLLSLVRKEYDWRINLTSSYISDTFARVYEKPVRFSDKISDLIIKIKNFMVQTGKTIEQVVGDIRNYLGYKCSFFRIQNGREVPINSDRIQKAYELISKRASFLQVENALYL
jgi:hypothetical protein